MIGRSEYLVRFDGFELDTRTGELRKQGTTTTRLSEQPLRILIALLERPGELVLREELRKRLWPNDTVVEFEHSINAAMKRLRQALGDSAENPQFIETLARRGYRWKTSLEWVASPPEQNAPAAHPDRNLIGKRVSHYRVLEILGGGGMGVVYKAEDIKLGRRVALKFLPEELANDPAAMQRFEREARAASALNHPNICTIHAVEEYEGQPFIVMELLEGRTLRETIAAEAMGSAEEKAPLQLKALLDTVTQIADGLDAAHKRGIIHRDIKPANIFVTTQGRVKILDFGLAKLHQLEVAEVLPQVSTEARAKREWNPHLTLTRTGATVGTAAYMSPEQVRGEKLDARTDLFSFGLILYEMTTRERAFVGDTAPLLHDAILNQTPIPIRELNRETPAKLVSIINKTIQKDREARYQSAEAIRADLESLRREMERHGLRWWSIAAGVIVASLSIASFWSVRRQPQSQPIAPEIKVRQLTVNSPDNRVTNGVISPDGRQLLYVDLRGAHLEAIDSGETRIIPAPDELRNEKVELDCSVWAPDSTRFLCTAHPAGVDRSLLSEKDRVGIWEFSVQGGKPRMLRDTAVACCFSPDGSHIAFGANSNREIWVMDTNGQRAYKVVESRDDSSVFALAWSADNQRLIYSREKQGNLLNMLSRDLKGGTTATIETEFGKDVENVLPLPDGRWIFGEGEPGPTIRSCNFWVARNDLRTGKLIEKPRRLTNWTGFCMNPTSATADGKKIAYVQYSNQLTVYVADLHSGGPRVSNLRHFTLTDTKDWPTDWTSDGKTLIFHSARGSREAIYKQSLNGDPPELLVPDQGVEGRAVVSPDGKWILYVQGDKSDEPSERRQLMRIPISGGTPQVAFPLQPRQVEAPWCAKSPSKLCVILERSEDHKEIVTAFDPIKGLGAELARIPLGANTEYFDFELSPDGTRIALISGLDTGIKIFSVRGAFITEIHIKGLNRLIQSRWAPDNKALFVAGHAPGGYVLLQVGLDGQTQPLIESHALDVIAALPSPDGQHLAMSAIHDNGNIWMLEDF